MAVPSNKSSSSAMISSRENHNSRNSEISNPIRRSFGGNPFTKPSIVANQRVSNPNTQANSPSEFQLISSMGRETVASLRGCEDKENPKDQNAKVGIVRSPASSKGTKNFMSPTISAASKITASPRKKILGERNEPARTSLSFANEKNPFRSVRFSDVVEDIDAEEDPGLQENKTEAADEEKARITASSIQEALRCEEVFDSEVPLTSKIESKSLPDEPDCVNIDPTFKISPTSSCSWSCPTVAPLDVDPSMPPYDPKANYLSPRPQFLHYRPNPRIELYLNKESDGRRLEESFSDTEVTEETQSDDSQRENEDVSSGDLSKEEEQEEVRVSEPSSFSTYMSKKIIEAKGGSKLPFFSRSKCIGLFLLLSLACLSISVTNSPVIEPSVLKVSSYFKINDSYEIVELAKANFDGLARNFFLWYAKTISVVSKLMQDFRGVHISGPLHYCNLTTLAEDIRVDGYLMFDHSYKGRGRKSEHNVLGPMRETKVDSEPPEEEGQPEPEADENIVEASGQHDKDYEGEVSQETEEVSEEHGTTESEEVLLALEAEVTEPVNLEAKETQEVVLIAGNLCSQEQSNVNYKEQPVTVPTADEIQPEVSEAGELQDESEIAFTKIELAKDGVDPESSELGASAENIRGSEVWESTVYVTKDGFLRANLLGIALLVLMLIAATAFIYMMKDGNPTRVTAVNVEQPLLAKKLDFSPICSTEQIFLSSRNWPTEMDVDGESCPSEMSSFQTISSYSKKGFEASSEAQSQERRKPGKNHKRDSIATSSGYSMGSPSYGSFTTYEKISSKHGLSEDEETITPVRRSSRIRNKVTSS
ncbi:hypothetical protein F2P56_028875 [Juglans regia]|uniref:Uncharacterized protein LOC108992368 n=2 Tax=Juglans regia TaxID=51240 RepID=A0A2I4ESV2_JUGRE|nr:uncharacterized protein LOC108992368 [Juglans regia]KAF5448330.1 hypothetical protein F2P56_028875 [Juglans regia]